MPGARTTIKAVSESPEAVEVSALWAATMFRSFLNRLLGAQNLVDIQIAAGAALQDLDEMEGRAVYGQRLEGSPEADLI